MSPAGKPLKRVKIARGQAVLGRAVTCGNLVFVGYEEESISAVDAVSLEKRWTISAGGVKPLKALAESGVLLAGYLRSRDCRAFDIDTGDELWSLRVKRPAVLTWHDHVLAHTEDAGFVRVELRTGDIQGEIPTRIDSPIGCAVAGDIFIYSRGEADPFYGLDLASDEAVWERPLLAEAEAVYFPPQDLPVLTLAPAGGDRVIASWSMRLLGLSAATGEIIWNTPGMVPYYEPNVYENHVVAWSRDEKFRNRLLCLSAESGGVIYDRDLASLGPEFGAVQQPTRGGVGHGRIAFGTRSGLLAVFRMSDGELEFSYQHAAPLFQPAFAAGRLFVPSYDGNLLVFEEDWR